MENGNQIPFPFLLAMPKGSPIRQGKPVLLASLSIGA